jgi:plastocyanin
MSGGGRFVTPLWFPWPVGLKPRRAPAHVTCAPRLVPMKTFPIRLAEVSEGRAMRNRFVLFALLLPVVGACSDSGSDDSSTPAVTAPISTPATPTPAVSDTTLAPVVADTSPAPVPASDGSAAATEVAVAIADFKFDPQTVNVPVGGSVVWTNNDAQQHTATSAGNFDAGAIDPQTSMAVTFETAGSFTYICSFHPFMTGTVVVG